LREYIERKIFGGRVFPLSNSLRVATVNTPGNFLRGFCGEFLLQYRVWGDMV